MEKDELPDGAAVSEVVEETGVQVELVGERRQDIADPVQLHGPGHQHIDLIYFARPRGSTEIHANYSEHMVGWYGRDEWDGLPLNAEVTGWCERALSAPEGYGSEQSRR